MRIGFFMLIHSCIAAIASKFFSPSKLKYISNKWTCTSMCRLLFPRLVLWHGVDIRTLRNSVLVGDNDVIPLEIWCSVRLGRHRNIYYIMSIYSCVSFVGWLIGACSKYWSHPGSYSTCMLAFKPVIDWQIAVKLSTKVEEWSSIWFDSWDKWSMAKAGMN